MSLLLLSWNVAGRVARLPEQVERVLGQGADIVCLQEVTARTAPVWRRELAAQGYRSIEQAPLAAGRSLAVLSAAREEPVEVVPVADLPLPERVLAVRLADGLEVVNVHSPISTREDLLKVRTHEAVHRHLAGPADHPRLVCGDLNTPRREHADGRIWTFARDQYGRLRPERGERWDAAELALIRGLEPHGFRDAFRSVHGWDRRERSWEWPRHGGGYRLDHLVVSARVEVLGCEYEHAWRRDGLSDHSALLARLRVRGAAGSPRLRRAGETEALGARPPPASSLVYHLPGALCSCQRYRPEYRSPSIPSSVRTSRIRRRLPAADSVPIAPRGQRE